MEKGQRCKLFRKLWSSEGSTQGVPGTARRLPAVGFGIIVCGVLLDFIIEYDLVSREHGGDALIIPDSVSQQGHARIILLTPSWTHSGKPAEERTANILPPTPTPTEKARPPALCWLHRGAADWSQKTSVVESTLVTMPHLPPPPHPREHVDTVTQEEHCPQRRKAALAFLRGNCLNQLPRLFRTGLGYSGGRVQPSGLPAREDSGPPTWVRSVLTRSLVPAAAQESSPLASNPTPSEAVSELKSWKKSSQRRSMWTVNHVEGTKLRMSKRRSSYRPEDQEAFYRLLEDPVIQSFLEADIFLKVSDKYLLSMVVEYFGRVGLPGHLYNRIHFFLALYIASDMEEDDPTSKQSIFQFLLGRKHWPDLYKEFLKLKVEFFHAMEHRAWVTPDLCEEIQAQNPHHWVWSRERQGSP
ncbi:PREDICTED: uncharacterized protein LOC103077888 [Lipotes vexillifer]|uniref:Uncharacterized protein LOC103077888 n=1 Tax=Lipotes vexillifer TaxID=118797 RepID=A0A340YB59_LIPVE|nr:PREDICTED: uncharacterized protein LOC103077888 [Lipotes vexillifer]